MFGILLNKQQLVIAVLLLKAFLSARTSLGFAPTITNRQNALGRASTGKWTALSRVVLESNPNPNEENHDDDGDDEWIAAEISEVIANDFEEKEEEEWIPDREQARVKREKAYAYQSTQSAQQTQKSSPNDGKDADKNQDETSTASPYTEEEKDVIRSMGGRSKKQSSPNKREPGYLGDSTLQEIATDYSVPVCYLADVLCMWGVPVPISVHDRLGDLVTGEQAFAILEAVNSLDVAALHDRYCNESLLNLCNYWDIDLPEAFEMAMKEGWSLPFGVHTVLRVEQEEELLRVLGGVN